MNIDKLNDIANRMVAAGKGILAADEIDRLDHQALRVDQSSESTETNRRDYREMLFRSTDAMKSYISGVILFDETLRQKAARRHAAGRHHQGHRRRARHQARQGPEAAALLSRRDRHRRPRRPRRPRCRIRQARR
ncbi:MAG: class I fructose-bisphosphate aldolase [Cypionkella sp.]